MGFGINPAENEDLRLIAPGIRNALADTRQTAWAELPNGPIWSAMASEK